MLTRLSPFQGHLLQVGHCEKSEPKTEVGFTEYRTHRTGLTYADVYCFRRVGGDFFIMERSVVCFG